MAIEVEENYFDDPDFVEESNPRLKVPRILGSVLMLIIGSLFVSSTLAGNISVNTGTALEFGQGISQATSCDSAITLTPFGSFSNSSGAGSFTFTGVSLTNLDTRAQGCAGETLSMASYGQTGNALSSFSISIASDGTFSSADGSISNVGSQGATSSATLTFSSPTVNTANVYKITIQSSTTPTVPMGSVYLNLASLTTPFSSNLDVGTSGAFTIEMFAKPTSNSVTQALYSGGPNGGQLGYFDAGCSATDKLFVGVWNESCNFWSSSGQYPVLNQWNHIAFQRDASNNISVYLNGTRIIYGNGVLKLGTSGSNDLYIGRIERGYFTGYISNFRLVRSAALYSGTTLTVPTSPLTLTPASGTVRSLLLMKTDAGLLTDETGAQSYTSAQTRTATPSGTSSTYSFSTDSPFR